MNNNHSVTLTISAEEFNRFQGDERKLLELTAEIQKLYSDERARIETIDILNSKVLLLEENVKTLENNVPYIKVNLMYKKRRDDFRLGEVFMPTPIESICRYGLIRHEEDKLNKIPKWIRKIFGVI